MCKALCQCIKHHNNSTLAIMTLIYTRRMYSAQCTLTDIHTFRANTRFINILKTNFFSSLLVLPTNEIWWHVEQKLCVFEPELRMLCAVFMWCTLVFQHLHSGFWIAWYNIASASVFSHLLRGGITFFGYKISRKAVGSYYLCTFCTNEKKNWCILPSFAFNQILPSRSSLFVQNVRF